MSPRPVYGVHPAVPARQAITDALHASGYYPGSRGVWLPVDSRTVGGWVDTHTPPPGWAYRPAEHPVTRATDRWLHLATGTVACAYRGGFRRTRQSPTVVLVGGAVKDLVALRPVFDASLPLRGSAPLSGRLFPPEVREAALGALALGGTPAFDAVLAAFLG